MAPTSWRAQSRGSCVSVSKVMTYLTWDSVEILPTIVENRSACCPRSKALRSLSFPRLRSCPIQSCSWLFQHRGRWSKKKRSLSGKADFTCRLGRVCSGYLALSCSMPLHISLSSASSSGRSCCGASGKSVSSANCKYSSRLPRKRTSSTSNNCSMLLALLNIVGMTTRVCMSDGKPLA